MASSQSAKKLQRRAFLCILGIPIYFSLLFVMYFMFYWTAQVSRLHELEVLTRTKAGFSESNSFLHYVNSTGGLNLHLWFDLCGFHVHRLRQTPLFPRFPHKRLYIRDLKSTSNSTQFGQRIFGFLEPRTSGYHQFAISSDDTSELWLSFDKDPSRIRLIASVSSPLSSAWTVYGDYAKYPVQVSRQIRLEANTSYYIEVLHKQGEGDSHIEVFWKLPGLNSFEIVRGMYLSPFYNDYDREKNYTEHENIPSQTRHEIDTGPGSLFLDFYHLPWADESDIGGVVSQCSYEPSFIVHRSLNRYEGVDLIHPSSVFPNDKTAFKSATRNSWASGNLLVDEEKAQSVVLKFMEAVEKRHHRKYSLEKVVRAEQTVDKEKGDRFLLELQLALRARTNTSLRLSKYVFMKKGSNELCFPEGYQWRRNANIYFILPVKNQGGWVRHFITEFTRLYNQTRDEHFFVIIIDFNSDDVDVEGMLNSSSIHQKITLIKKSGPFHKTLAIQEAASRVPSPRDIVFLFDLHIDVPLDLLDSIRKHTIQGKIAYSPAVGRLECGSFRDDPAGFWQVNGFGIMAVYKSDWDRFKGMNVQDFTTKWGGEDWDLVDRILGSQLEILQLKQPGLLHYYHSHNGMWNSTRSD